MSVPFSVVEYFGDLLSCVEASSQSISSNSKLQLKLPLHSSDLSMHVLSPQSYDTLLSHGPTRSAEADMRETQHVLHPLLFVLAVNFKEPEVGKRNVLDDQNSGTSSRQSKVDCDLFLFQKKKCSCGIKCLVQSSGKSPTLVCPPAESWVRFRTESNR